MPITSQPTAIGSMPRGEVRGPLSHAHASVRLSGIGSSLPSLHRPYFSDRPRT
jgi:hypothetical protein